MTVAHRRVTAHNGRMRQAAIGQASEALSRRCSASETPIPGGNGLAARLRARQAVREWCAVPYL